MISFKEWIVKQAKRDDPVGDFAVDVLTDYAFPETSDRNEIKSHLRKMNACGEAIEAFEEAYKEYKKEIKQ